MRLFVAIPGQPNANRGFSIFSKKLIFVEFRLKFEESVAEFKDLGLKLIDLGSKFEDSVLKVEDLGFKFEDLGRKLKDL